MLWFSRVDRLNEPIRAIMMSLGAPQMEQRGSSYDVLFMRFARKGRRSLDRPRS